jgi:hypothetical protein
MPPEPAGALHLGGGRLGDFEVEVGSLHLQDRARRVQEHVGQDRDRVAAFDHAVDVVQRLEEVRPFEDDTHDQTSSLECKGRSPATGIPLQA